MTMALKKKKDRQYNGLKKKKDRQYNGLKERQKEENGQTIQWLNNGLKKKKRTDNTMA